MGNHDRARGFLFGNEETKPVPCSADLGQFKSHALAPFLVGPMLVLHGDPQGNVSECLTVHPVEEYVVYVIVFEPRVGHFLGRPHEFGVSVEEMSVSAVGYTKLIRWDFKHLVDIPKKGFAEMFIDVICHGENEPPSNRVVILRFNRILFPLPLLPLLSLSPSQLPIWILFPLRRHGACVCALTVDHSGGLRSFITNSLDMGRWCTLSIPLITCTFSRTRCTLFLDMLMCTLCTRTRRGTRQGRVQRGGSRRRWVRRVASRFERIR